MRILIAITFFALAAWFLVGSRSTSMPEDLGGSAANPIPISSIDPSVLRESLTDPPAVLLGGLFQECNHCHNLFPSRLVTERELQQHRHLVHDHGTNDRCFNCHEYEDRSKLVLHDGEVIGFESSTRLCAKCHGPTWRDWQAGMHGRTMGYWDTTRGKQVRLECVQCHDPHAPAFDPMAPLPGPDTLRMGHPTPPHGGESDARRNPLELPARSSERAPAREDHEGTIEE